MLHWPFHDLFYTATHTHTSSRETSFFSSNTFAKWAHTYLRILLNTGTLTSVSNSPVLWNNPSALLTAACHWWVACLTGWGEQVTGWGKEGRLWSREGTQDRKDDNTETSQFTVVTLKQPCDQKKMTCSLQWLWVINFYLAVCPLWWPFQHPVWVCEGWPRGACLPAKIVWILSGILDLCILGNISRSAYL